MITFEELKQLQDGVHNAAEDDTPYLAVMDDEMHVVGNPNKTQHKAFNYTVKFAFPKNDERTEKYRKEKVIKETENYLVCEKEYKNVSIPIRQHPTIVNAFVRVESFIMAVTDEGEIRDLSEDELKLALQALSTEIIDAVYDAVGSVLGMNKFETDNIGLLSAIQTLVLMQNDIPEVVNEADYFFAL